MICDILDPKLKHTANLEAKHYAPSLAWVSGFKEAILMLSFVFGEICGFDPFNAFPKAPSASRGSNQCFPSPPSPFTRTHFLTLSCASFVSGVT